MTTKLSDDIKFWESEVKRALATPDIILYEYYEGGNYCSFKNDDELARGWHWLKHFAMKHPCFVCEGEGWIDFENGSRLYLEIDTRKDVMCKSRPPFKWITDKIMPPPHEYYYGKRDEITGSTHL